MNAVSPALQPFDFHGASTSEHLIYQLQTTTNRLQNAFDGVDVSWIDSGLLTDIVNQSSQLDRFPDCSCMETEYCMLYQFQSIFIPKELTRIINAFLKRSFCHPDWMSTLKRSRFSYLSMSGFSKRFDTELGNSKCGQIS